MKKIKIEGYSNTMLAYSVEIADFVNDGWVVLDRALLPRIELEVFLVGLPDEKIGKYKPFSMENKANG